MRPSHGDIAEIIREWVATGRYMPGDRLPTHQEIADDIGTSRQTVVAAIRVLSQEGVLQTGGSRGTWVREKVVFTTDATAYDSVHAPRPNGGDAFVSAVQESGRTPDTRFEMRIEPATEEIAAHMGVAPDELVCVRSVGQLVDSHPWSRATSYYPMDLTRACGLDEPRDIPEGTVRRMSAHGYAETGSVDDIDARPPTADEARDLGVPSGTAMIVWTRVAATDERITRVTTAWLPGDRNQLRFRQGSAKAVEAIFAARRGTEEEQ